MAYESTTGTLHNLSIGSEVFTSDGDKLGEVKEMRGNAFHVDAPMQPDYWLPIHTVNSSTGGRVIMSFHKDRLGDFKIDEPRAG